MPQKIIQQGAEAIILLSKNVVTKNRIKKSYRIPELDEKIRKLRTRSETKLLTKASEIINSPKPLSTCNIYQIPMPFINGKRLSEKLNEFSLKKQKQICKQIGENIAKLHDKNIIHGDLTTSNMILKNNKNSMRLSAEAKKKVAQPQRKGGVDKGNLGSLYFIDFGLGFISRKYEDKAVDLHLLKQALEAKHFQNWEALFKKVINAYKKSKDSKIVFKRLKAVEKRGRYKH